MTSSNMVKPPHDMVYLKESNSPKHRSLERPDLPRHRPDTTTWYSESRSAPQHNARYLKKLGHLREELIQQEHRNLNQALDRFRSENLAQHRSLDVKQQRPSKVVPHHTGRNRKVQQQQQQRFANDAFQLETLQGAGLTEGQLEKRGEKEDLKPSDVLGDIQDIIAYQRARLAQLELDHPGKPQSHQSSIPTLRRRSVKAAERLQPLTGTNLRRTDSFIRQMSLHHKDSKGLYRGLQYHNLPATKRRLVDLSFNTENTVDQQHPGSREKQYTNSTPRSSDADVIESARDNPNPEQSQISPWTPRSADRTQDQQQQQDPDTNHQRQNPKEYAQGIRPSLLRTSTSLYAPTRYGYIRVAKVDNNHTNNKKKHPVRGSQAARKSVTNHIPPENFKQDMEVTGLKSEHSLLSQHSDRPATIPMQMEDGDVILVNQTDTSLPVVSETMTYEGDATAPQCTRGTTPTNSVTNGPGLEESDSKVSLVVELPGIRLNPATPMPDEDDDDDDTSLRKTFRDNAIRKQEVSDLLKEVRDLSSGCEDRVEETSTHGSDADDVEKEMASDLDGVDPNQNDIHEMDRSAVVEAAVTV